MFRPQVASARSPLNRNWLSGMRASMYQPLPSIEVWFSHTAFQS